MEEKPGQIKYGLRVIIMGSDELSFPIGTSIPFDELKAAESVFYVERTFMQELNGSRISGPLDNEGVESSRRDYSNLLKVNRKDERDFPLRVYQLKRIE